MLFRLRVSRIIDVVFYVVVIGGILYVANQYGVNLIAEVQGVLGMILLVSPNWDGFDDSDDWQLAHWFKCDNCLEWYEETGAGCPECNHGVLRDDLIDGFMNDVEWQEAVEESIDYGEVRFS
jgi:hypothetical protein